MAKGWAQPFAERMLRKISRAVHPEVLDVLERSIQEAFASKPVKAINVVVSAQSLASLDCEQSADDFGSFSIDAEYVSLVTELND
jgi:hypothetical protein